MKKHSVYLMLLSVALMWGGTYVGSKTLVNAMPPTAAVAIRWGLASLLLIPILFARKRKMPTGSDWLWLLLLGLIGIGLYNYFFFKALVFTKSSDATMVLSIFNPSLAVLFAMLFFREKLSKKQRLGFLIAVSGTLLFFPILNETFTQQRLLGIGFLLISASSAACYALLSKPVMLRLDSTTVCAFTIMAGSVVLIIMAIPEIPYIQWHQLTAEFWMVEFLLALFPSVLANLFYFKAIQVLGPALAISVNYIVPIISLWLGSLLLHDTITLTQLLGAVVMIIGIWFIQQRQKVATLPKQKQYTN